MTAATETKNKPLYATRDFNDAGTEKSFKFGQDVSDEPGAANYRAAGLASDEKPDATSDEASDA